MGWEKLVNLAHFKACNIHLIPEKTRKNHIYRKTWEEFVAQVDDGNDLETMSKIFENIVAIPKYCKCIIWSIWKLQNNRFTDKLGLCQNSEAATTNNHTIVSV